MENVSDSQSPKFSPFSLSVMLPTLNPLITQPLSPIAKCLVSKYSVWFQSGDFILSYAAYLEIGGIIETSPIFHPSQQKHTLKKTNPSSVCNSSPSPISFHWSQLHCLNTLSPSVGMFSKNPLHFQICKIRQNACNEYFYSLECI